MMHRARMCSSWYVVDYMATDSDVTDDVLREKAQHHQ